MKDSAWILCSIFALVAGVMFGWVGRSYDVNIQAMVANAAQDRAKEKWYEAQIKEIVGEEQLLKERMKKNGKRS